MFGQKKQVKIYLEIFLGNFLCEATCFKSRASSLLGYQVEPYR